MNRADGSYDVPGLGLLPSVTTVLKTLGMVGIDTGLFYAAQSMVAKAAPDVAKAYWGADWDDEVAREIESGLSNAASARMNSLADRGTVVHRYANGLASEVLMDWDWFMESNTDLSPAEGSEALCDVLREWWGVHKPKTILSEWAGYSEAGYAGSPDWYGTINGEPWLLDFKTSDTWRLDHVMQVAAYRKFTHWHIEGEVVKAALDPATKCAIVIVKEDKVQVYSPNDLDKWYNNFLRILSVWYDWSKTGECQNMKELGYKVF